MSFRLNSLGLKLNLALLLFFLVVGFATAAVVYFGFNRTRENANTRSREALEELGEQNLQEIANSQADFGALQMEWAAAIGHRSARYLQEFRASGGSAPFDVSRLTRTSTGLWQDPDPGRGADLIVLPMETFAPGVLDDIAYSAALNSLFPALIAGFPGEIADESFHPSAIVFVSVNGMGLYYPPRGTVYETTPPDLDLADVFEDMDPQHNPGRKTLWTPPYQDLAGQGLVITARTPVYEGDTFRGMFEVDLLIGNLVETVNLVKPTGNGFAFYVDVRGEILRTDAYDLLANELESQNNEVLAGLVEKMKVGERGAQRVRIAGEDFFIAYSPLTQVGGGFAVAAPVAELTAEASGITAGIDEQADQTMTVVLTSMAILFALALVGATYLNRRVLLRPIEALVAGTRAVAQGDLRIRIPVRGDDELATLGHSFNRMTDGIMQRDESLRQEVRERQAAQEELRALFAAMTDMVFTVDSEGRFLGVADTGSPMKHTMTHGSVGQTLYDVMPRVIVDPILESIRAALLERRTVMVEFAREAGGRTEWHSAAVSPLSDTSVVAVVRDITERVIARQQLELQRDALQQEVIERKAAQEELRALFAAMTDRVIVFDRDGRVTRLPETNAVPVGVAPEDLQGMTLHSIVPDDQAERVLGSIRQALNERATVTEEYPYVVGDRTYWFSSAFSPISQDEVVMVARDITDRINARQELERQVQERTQELRALLDVSGNVTSTLELAPLLDLIIAQISRVVEHWRASLFLVQDGGLFMVNSRVNESDALATDEYATAGRRVLTFEEMQPFWGELSAGRAVIIDDVRDGSDNALVYQRATAGRAPEFFGRTRSFLAVPLVLKDQTIGMLAVAHEEPAFYAADHARLLAAFASQVAIAVENARLYEQVQARSQELQTLLSVSRNVASTLELGPLLQLIIEQVKEIADYSRCSVFLLEADSIVLLDSQSTASSEAVSLRIPLDLIQPLWDRISSGEPAIVDDVRGASPLAAAYRRGSGALLDTAFRKIHSWMGVPLESKDRLIGMLTLSHEEKGFYTKHHASLVTGIATQIAVAIENARLYEQGQQLAAVEERQRLARELHDSVSQALYGIALGARTARTLLDRDPSKAAEPVDYVLSLAEAGLTEMRALIFELRPESLEIEGLVVALDKQIAATAARYGIEVTSELAEEPEMSLAHKEIFYRIGQEALHNVVKHARASKASVRLGRDNGSFVLEVGDNGVGFDSGQSFPGHMGLVSMSERAASIGARLEVESSPGKGTTVKLRSAALES